MHGGHYAWCDPPAATGSATVRLIAAAVNPPGSCRGSRIPAKDVRLQ